MREKKLYVCRRCHEWYSCDAKRNPQPCPKCHIAPLPVDIDYDEWELMSKTRRDEYKQRYIMEHKHEMDASADDQNHKKFEPRSSITLVHVMGTLVMLACVCAGIFLGGLPGCLIGIIGGLASAAGLWLFAGMAEDLQAMREAVEDLSDTLSKTQKEQKNS